jgi:ABC-type antimicrobial peptide transport system permease subunit
MILHLGGDAVVPTEDIIAIIDMEAAAQAAINKEFIKTAEEEGFVQYISDDPPKSFILAEVNKKTILFMSPISSVTLLKRSGFIGDISMDRAEDKGDIK